jgi:hypothetical protein
MIYIKKNKFLIIISFSFIIVLTKSVPLNNSQEMKYDNNNNNNNIDNNDHHHHLDSRDQSSVLISIYLGIMISSIAVLMLICQMFRDNQKKR